MGNDNGNKLGDLSALLRLAQTLRPDDAAASIAARRRRVGGAAPPPPTPEAVQAKRRMVATLCRLFAQELKASSNGGADANGHPSSAAPPDLDATLPARNATRRTDLAPSGADNSTQPLSRRTRQTLDLLLDGDSEKQIALKLHISPHTVHQYVKMLYKRFAVSSRSELLARWVKRDAQ